MKKYLLGTISFTLICAVAFINITAAAVKSPSFEVYVPQDILVEPQLEYYVEEVENLNYLMVDELNSTDIIPATITFSQYVSFSELAEYIRAYGVNLQQVQLRAFLADGTKVTMATLVSEGLVYTEELMYNEAIENDFELAGITDIYAYIPVNQIKSIEANNLTYLVDATYSSKALQVVEDCTEVARASSFQRALMNASEETDSQFQKSLTWELEELGLLVHD